MKPQQLLNEAAALGHALQEHVVCARTSFPAITAVAVAIASSVVLTLAGCANSAGIGSNAQTIAPASIGLEAGVTAPVVVADWWKNFGDTTLNEIVDRALGQNQTRDRRR
jgi:hypothetical protein